MIQHVPRVTHFVEACSLLYRSGSLKKTYASKEVEKQADPDKNIAYDVIHLIFSSLNI